MTKSLQSATCDIGKAYRDVQLSKDLVLKACSESTWDGVWKRIEAMAKDLDITIVKPRTAVTQRHRANAGLEKTPKDYFRVNNFYPFIDHVVQECETRFSTKHSSLIAAQALIPANLNDLSEACLNKIKAYNTKEDNIDMEVEKVKLLFKDTPAADIPKDGCSVLAACDPEYFPSIHRILVIFLTTKVGSVSCERSFSALRRLKLWTRSTMSEDRFSGLALLLVHTDTQHIPGPDDVYESKANWRNLC